MKPGTVIRLPDGREGTVVYHSLDGYGIRWGRVRLTAEEVEALYEAQGGLFGHRVPDYLQPEAMLRDVGQSYEVVWEPEERDHRG